MGGTQAASVLAQVKKEGMEKAGQKWDPTEESSFRANIEKRYDSEGQPYFSSARLWDDGIIDPKDTRDVIGMSLSVALNSPIEMNSKYGVFRM